ncbi:MAG: energy transducer TonB [Bacteroidota bacterium]
MKQKLYFHCIKLSFLFIACYFLQPVSAISQSSGLTEIFNLVEQMPRFAGCEHLPISNEEKKACAEKRMLEFIYSNIKYPERARENGTQGMVVVSFVVRKTGEITDIEIAHDIGNGCGTEVVRIVKSMPDWIPGFQNGRPVNVLFKLPVRFTLEDKNQKKKRKG